MTHQFDICELRRANGPVTHVVVLQHDDLSDVGTIIVAPLHLELRDEKRPRLHPCVELNGGTLFLMVERLAAVDRREVGRTVGSAADCRFEIMRALDIATVGF